MLKAISMKPNHINLIKIRFQCIKTLLGRGFSSTTAELNDKVYELRTYYIHPKDTKALLTACNNWMHVRMSYSKMVGFWLSEIGGMNDVLHLWEYDSLAHRARIRQALATDAVWQGEFISKILPMILRQENCVVKCLPGTSLTTPTDPGVYEIQNFQVNCEDLETAGKHIKEINKPGALLVGSFYTIIGDLSSDIKFGNSRILLPTAFSEMK